MVWVTPGGKPAGFTVAPVTLPSIAYLISAFVTSVYEWLSVNNLVKLSKCQS